MRIITATDCGMTFDGRAFAPGEGAVLTDWFADQVEERIKARGGHTRASSMSHYTRLLRPEAVHTGDRLVTFRGLAIGDQLIWAGLLQIILDLLPGLQIDFHCPPPMIKALWADCHNNLPFTVNPDPISFADWKAAEWHLPGEALIEDDTEPDQPNMWDALLQYAGIDPATVMPDQKIALLPYSREDWDRAEKLGTFMRQAKKPVILWHLAASTGIRSYAPAPTRAALQLLLDNGFSVVVTGSAMQLEAYAPLPSGCVILRPKDIPIRTALNLVRFVDLLVCPDSCFRWAAEAVGTPCVSLWSAHLPKHRTGAPIRGALVGDAPCVPCLKHEKPWLAKGCPAHGGGACRALAKIAPDTILRTVKELLR